MSVITTFFQEHFNEDLEGAKFKIGELVKINTENRDLQIYNGIQGKILGISFTEHDELLDKDIFEYAISGYPYLLWEHELELVEISTTCSQCGAPKHKNICIYCGV